jgi:hypothetical protein
MLARFLLAATVTLAAALPLSAQGLFGMTGPADRLMSDALASPQGAALLTTFAANVRKSGDPACLQAKALDEAALVAGGRTLLHRRGVQTMRILEENFDHAAYQAALAEAGEPDAVGEVEKLRDEPDVKAFIALLQPAQLARLLDYVLEQFDRHVLVARINLHPVSPAPRGEPDPIKDNLIESAETAAQKYLDEHPSPQVDRYLDLVEVMDTARPKGLPAKAGLNIGPMKFFAGVEGDLAELCVGKRQR